MQIYYRTNMAGFNEEMTNLKCNLEKSLRSKPLSPLDVLACVTAISNYLQKQKIPVDLVREHTIEIVEKVFHELFASDQTVPDLVRPLLPGAIDAGLKFSSRCFAWVFSFFSKMVKSQVAVTIPAVVAAVVQAEEVGLVPQGTTEHVQLRVVEPLAVVDVEPVPVEPLAVVDVEPVPVEPVAVVDVEPVPVEPVPVEPVPVEPVQVVEVLKPVAVPFVSSNTVFQPDLD